MKRTALMFRCVPRFGFDNTEVRTIDLDLPADAGERALHLARKARDWGLDGVVASAKEARAIREACGEEFLIVTPGIRPAGAATSDQKRVLTPAEALAAGASHRVVGRPVTQAPDPAKACEEILKQMA